MTVPRRGSSTSVISALLHFGQWLWTGKTVAEQAPQELPISCGFSCGHVEIVGSIAFCIEAPRGEDVATPEYVHKIVQHDYCKAETSFSSWPRACSEATEPVPNPA